MQTTARNIALGIAILALLTAIALFIAWIKLSLDLPTSTQNSSTAASSAPSSVQPIAVASLSATPPSQLLFSDNFDDGFAHGFTFYSGAWKVVEDDTGNKVLQMNSPSTCCAMAQFGPSNLSDGIVELRFKVISTNYQAQLHVLEFGFRSQTTPANNITEYQLTFDPEQSNMSLIYQENGGDWQPMEGISGGGLIHIQENGWVTLRVEFQGKNIRIFIDGNPFITAMDSRINSGRLLLGANGPTGIQFDDLKVWEPLK